MNENRVPYIAGEGGISIVGSQITIPPYNEIDIASGKRSQQGRAKILNTPLEAIASGRFVHNYLNLRTKHPQLVRLVRSGDEFILPPESKINLPQIIAYIVS